MRHSRLRPPTPLGLVLAVLFLCCPCLAQTAVRVDAARGHHTQDVAVRGSVNKPGRLNLPTNATAWAALQAAGGLLPNADADHVTIKHTGETDGIPFQYSLARQRPDDPKVNPVLQDGDIIVVPTVAPPLTFTISGPGIRNPAEYALATPTVSLATVIGRAGGLEDRAEIDHVRITRRSPAGLMTVIDLNAANPDVLGKFQVQPGDVIFIGQGKRKSRIDLPPGGVIFIG